MGHRTEAIRNALGPSKSLFGDWRRHSWAAGWPFGRDAESYVAPCLAVAFCLNVSERSEMRYASTSIRHTIR